MKDTRPLRVLLVNTSDQTGGAAIAAMRLLKALRTQRDVEVKFLCRDRQSPDSQEEIVSLEPSFWQTWKFVWERGEIFLANGLRKAGLFAIDTGRYGTDITNLPEFEEADVIHLHWVNQAMLSLRNIRKILRSGKRVVWTMHDMWCFTGVCHYASSCENWRTRCLRCPQLHHPWRFDLSAFTFRAKQKTFRKAPKPVTFVGCSKWLASLAAEAPLLKGHKVVNIPNPIDTDFYAPAENPAAVRAKLNLPSNKRILLFTAYKVTDPIKGFNYLTEALMLLVEENPEMREKLVLVLVGKRGEEARDAFPIETRAMGYVTSRERMRELYQAADLLLMPTMMDNLPNTISESMACGTPCVAFNVGGVPQMVDTGVNGYLADYCNSLDFARGIVRILTSASYDALCRNARSKALVSYGEKIIAEKYMDIYKDAYDREERMEEK